MAHPDDSGAAEAGLTPAIELDDDAAVELLTAGELTVEGRLVDASNATLYCAVAHDGRLGACVYKPEAGERPLWDFPDGTLARRETAAYLVSQAFGGRIVPPTVWRADGPFGAGMAQLWIDTDPDIEMREVLRSWSTQLQRLVVFDAIINNADRKGGHLLPTRTGHLHAVDHGVSFHVEDKLRTILWSWAGQDIPTTLLDDVTVVRGQLDGQLGTRLRAHLTAAEVRALRRRVDRLLALGQFPEPSDQWPSVPWPPW